MIRVLLALLAVLQPSPLLANTAGADTDTDTGAGTAIPLPAAGTSEVEAALASARTTAPECEEGCITPREAFELAYAAGEGVTTPGRFLLDVQGGGRSFNGELEDLFFVNSQLGYARFGTLTIALERDALWALLRRARVCGGGVVRDGQIEVRACHQEATEDLNMFTMMQALGNRRIVVEGEARLLWIDARTGTPRPVANKRGDNELGYYQVWVRVNDADQVIFVFDD